MSALYDWVWRKDAREKSEPMTFRRLTYEAREVCSLDLFLRLHGALQLVDECYLQGLLWEFFGTGDESQSNSDLRWLLHRVIEQAFVRAYLAERRAGLPPRSIGGLDLLSAMCERQEEVRAWVDKASQRQRDAWQTAREREWAERERNRGLAFAAIWGAVGFLAEARP